MSKRAAVALVCGWGAVLPLSAHPGHDDEAVISYQNAASSSLENRVSITVEGDKRIIESNGIPDHKTGSFPNPGNPNRISGQDYHFEITTEPREGKPHDFRGALFGVAINGVVFDPGTGEYDRESGWRIEAIIGGKGTLGIDSSDAHVQPSGAYHYHGIPWGLIKEHKAEGKMFLLGWAADGFPIYGPEVYTDADNPGSGLKKVRPSYRLKSGSRPSGREGPGGKYDGTYTNDFEYVEGSGDLDECNGRHGVTPEFPDGTYYYVLTETFPYVPRMFMGQADSSFMQHRPGPGQQGGPPGMPGMGPGGRPPVGPGQGPPPPPPI